MFCLHKLGCGRIKDNVPHSSGVTKELWNVAVLVTCRNLNNSHAQTTQTECRRDSDAVSVMTILSYSPIFNEIYKICITVTYALRGRFFGLHKHSILMPAENNKMNEMNDVSFTIMKSFSLYRISGKWDYSTSYENNELQISIRKELFRRPKI